MCKFLSNDLNFARESRPDGEGKRARRRNKKARDFTHFLTQKSTLLSKGVGSEAIERLRFLTSLPLAGTGQREGGEKTQPFNRFQSRLGITLVPLNRSKGCVNHTSGGRHEMHAIPEHSEGTEVSKMAIRNGE